MSVAEPSAATISVVVPCFNARDWLARTLRSVGDQPSKAHQIILVDDGSDDGSADAALATGVPCQILRQRNKGACHARNVGLAASSAKYVMFLDADDYLEGDFLGRGVAELEKCSGDIAFAPCWVEMPGQPRSMNDHLNPPPTPGRIFAGWFDQYAQQPCSIIWRSEFVRSIGGWDNRVLRNQDGEIILRAMLHQPKICHFQGGFGVHNAHSQPSISKLRRSDVFRSEFDALVRLIESAEGTSFEVELGGFGRKLYNLARGAFVVGDTKLGKLALAKSREVGFRGHDGSRRHRIAASLTGLERKTKLVSWLRP
ncbi:MAG: glycosyltransferase family 2 protein [bacterium]|nr:glycosyltransferase family 2 protein [bacterium]